NAKAFDRTLVDIDAQSGFGRQRHQSIPQQRRLVHEILSKIEMREADTPIDRWHRACEMDGRRRRNAGFSDLGSNVQGQAELYRATPRLKRRGEAAELDQL